MSALAHRRVNLTTSLKEFDMFKRHSHRGAWVLLSGGFGLAGCTVIHEAPPYDDTEGCGAMGGDDAVGGKGPPSGNGGNGEAVGGTGGGGAGDDEGGATGGGGNGDDNEGSGASSASGGSETGGGPGAPTSWMDLEPRIDWNSLEPPAECDDVERVAWPLSEGGTVIASDDGPDTADAARVFDLNTGTRWVVPGNPTPWVGYDFDGESPVVVSYQLAASPDGIEGSFPHPKSWELQATNSDDEPDEANWTTLDTQSDQEFTSSYAKRLYTFENSNGYRRYRLFVTANAGGPDFELAEFSLLGPGAPAFSVDEQDIGTSVNQFSYNSTWDGRTVDTNSARYDGTTSWSRVQGNWAELTFEGTGIELYAVIDPKHGIVGVTLNDEAPQLVDLFGAETLFNTLAYRSPRLCPGEHKLRIEVTGTRNPSASDVYASLDRAVIIP